MSPFLIIDIFWKLKFLALFNLKICPIFVGSEVVQCSSYQESIGNELVNLQKFQNISFISSLHYECISFVNIHFRFKIYNVILNLVNVY